jgi:Cdc6-like AAA superfamily ATPase
MQLLYLNQGSRILDLDACLGTSRFRSYAELSVVLLDELDQLAMGKQNVLYNLFNWPNLPNSRLIVVAVANTMNLTDMLSNKIQSRVGMSCLVSQLIQV